MQLMSLGSGSCPGHPHRSVKPAAKQLGLGTEGRCARHLMGHQKCPPVLQQDLTENICPTCHGASPSAQLSCSTWAASSTSSCSASHTGEIRVRYPSLLEHGTAKAATRLLSREFGPSSLTPVRLFDTKRLTFAIKDNNLLPPSPVHDRK